MARKQKKNGGAIDDDEWYAGWNREHTFCHCCGIPEGMAASMRWPGLSTHHMVKQGRSDEACNLLRLCQRCHDLAEGHQIRDPDTGGYFPKLPLAVCLTIKLEREPGDYDEARLLRLRGRPLPDREPIPEVFREEWCHWRHPATCTDCA